MQKLTADQERIANGVAAVLGAKNPDGSPMYSKRVIRDFAVAYVLEKRLFPVPADMQPLFVDFLSQIQLPADATDVQLAAAVRLYFDQNPLPPSLTGGLERFARGEILSDRDDFDEEKGAASELARLRATGTKGEKRAPKAQDKKKNMPKPKKGLS